MRPIQSSAHIQCNTFIKLFKHYLELNKKKQQQNLCDSFRHRRVSFSSVLSYSLPFPPPLNIQSLSKFDLYIFVLCFKIPWKRSSILFFYYFMKILSYKFLRSTVSLALKKRKKMFIKLNNEKSIKLRFIKFLKKIKEKLISGFSVFILEVDFIGIIIKSIETTFISN